MNPFLLPDDNDSPPTRSRPSKPPDVRFLASEENVKHTGNWNDPPARLSRSPRPYKRKAREFPDASPLPSSTNSFLPTPALTPAQSDTDPFQDHATPGFPRLPTRTLSPLDLATPGESGAEADDEGFNFTKALPPPPIRPRKGLRGEQEQDINDERVSPGKILAAPQAASLKTNERHQDISHLQESFIRDKSIRGRLWQRGGEAACIGMMICLIAFSSLRSNNDNSSKVSYWILFYTGSLAALVTLLLLRRFHTSVPRGFRHVGILSKIDPAPILYPPLLPLLVAVSTGSSDNVLLVNAILGLSTLPRRLVSSTPLESRVNTLHWVITLLPVFALKILKPQDSINDGGILSNSPSSSSVDLSLLFPLHQAMLSPLRYLTTNSLLSSEIQLLSVALVNLLIHSINPQMKMLKYILWIGGLGVFYLCRSVLKSSVALERIPLWRFRRAGTVVRATQTFWGTLAEGLKVPGATIEKLPGNEIDGSSRSPNGHLPENLKHNPSRKNQSDEQAMPQTTPLTLRPESALTSSIPQVKSRRRKPSSAIQSYLSMTPAQLNTRKWLYAIYTYLVVAFLILVPIRSNIGRHALQDTEPFGWAISYLFSDIPIVQSFSQDYPIRAWIPPTPAVPDTSATSTWTTRLQSPMPSTRRLLFIYWLTVVCIAVATVILLAHRVAVDTRRKVFHFAMVGILFPTAYIDPCYLSLGLVLVLTVFLLLELLRASQLRPLAQPLAHFLSPYIDGRDLRGPIVISHIFLLLGCSIPLWLSLASLPSAPAEAPWSGWTVLQSDVSMLAGVICVGMGDAAASLVGRAIGRHKWPWPGGKSLEGSTAFALAVTCGLMLGRWWLVVGGWSEHSPHWTHLTVKAGAAAAIAAMSEALLTGCNDNVVVPLILWLAVRSLNL